MGERRAPSLLQREKCGSVKSYVLQVLFPDIGKITNHGKVATRCAFESSSHMESNLHLKGCRKGYSEINFCFHFDAGQGKELVGLQLITQLFILLFSSRKQKKIDKN